MVYNNKDAAYIKTFHDAGEKAHGKYIFTQCNGLEKGLGCEDVM